MTTEGPPSYRQGYFSLGQLFIDFQSQVQPHQVEVPQTLQSWLIGPPQVGGTANSQVLLYGGGKAPEKKKQIFTTQWYWYSPMFWPFESYASHLTEALASMVLSLERTLVAQVGADM